MKFSKRLCSFILALCMMLGAVSSSVAYAAEDTCPAPNGVSQTTEGISPASVQTAFGPGEWYWGGVTFTGSNGGAYKTVNGSKIKLKIFFKAVDNEPYSYHLFLSFREYGGREVYYRDLNSWSVDPNEDGFLYYESDWLSVHNGVDYRFHYDANSECACYDPRRVEVHIWVDIQ